MLGIVPDYTVIFLQLIVVQSLFQVFDTSFYTALYAKGRLKENALISPTFGLLRFPLIYVLFKFGCSPVALSWASLFTYVILGLIVKPILIVKIAEYTVKDVFSVFIPCLKVTVTALIPIYVIDSFFSSDSLLGFILEGFLIVVVVASAIAFVGIDRETRNKAVQLVKKRLRK